MIFRDSFYFYWLWAVVVVYVLIRVSNQRMQTKIKNRFATKLYSFLSSSLSPAQRRLKNILSVVVVFFLILALARPQSGQKKVDLKSEGVELMLLLDVSESMLAEDVRPSRLEQAKIEMGRLIEKLPGHKIGIVAFAGSATLLSPLTSDPGALKMYLDSLSTSSVSEQGTDFSKALSESKAAFERGGLTNGSGSRVTRVILFASDGEDQEPGALKLAEDLSKEGTRIFSLAYGTKNGGVIPVRDSLGFLKGNKKSRGGQEIQSKVNGEALQALASAGRGQFYFASFGGQHLDSLVNDINQLEKTQFDSTSGQQVDENFQAFLLIALLMALLELILGERRSAVKIWKGRFEVSR